MEKETPEEVRDRLLNVFDSEERSRADFIQIEQTYQLARIADALDGLKGAVLHLSGISDALEDLVEKGIKTYEQNG